MCKDRYVCLKFVSLLESFFLKLSTDRTFVRMKAVSNKCKLFHEDKL